MLRIISGKLRGKKLLAPPENITRPTLDRVRECLFSTLISMRSLQGSHVVDAFAGSGAFGIEAYSRGAGHVTFVEHHPAALKCLKQNLLALPRDASILVEADALKKLQMLQPIDILFLDPPYNTTLLEQVLNLPLPLNEAAVIVCETLKSKPLAHPGYALIKEKVLGQVKLLFLQKISED